MSMIPVPSSQHDQFFSQRQQNVIPSCVVRKDVQEETKVPDATKCHPLQRNVIPSCVVRKDVQEGNNDAGCNEMSSPPA